MKKSVFRINETLELDITQLKRAGLFCKGKTTGFSYYQNGLSRPLFPPTIMLGHSRGGYSLQLIYFHRLGNEQIRMDYRIEVEEVPANLGKGTLLYFICPKLGIRCRKLYKTHRSSIWKSRKAYQGQLYYPVQLESKRWQANARYWQLKKLLANTCKRNAFLYDGKETKRAKRIRELHKRMQEMNERRFEQLKALLPSI